MTREEVLELIDEAIFYDGLDEAIIGVCDRINLSVTAYDREKCIEILANDFEINDEDLEEGETIENAKYQMAIEHFEYNIIGGWIGENTPVFITLT